MRLKFNRPDGAEVSVDAQYPGVVLEAINALSVCWQAVQDTEQSWHHHFILQPFSKLLSTWRGVKTLIVPSNDLRPEADCTYCE